MSSFNLEYVSCNLCGSDNYHLKLEKKGDFTNKLFRIVECNCCGLVYVNPRLTGEAISALYDEEYFQGKGFDETVNYVRELKESHINEAKNSHVIGRISAVHPSPADLLEIGPGMGLILSQAKQAGYQVTGLDISQYAVQVLREQGFESIQGVIPSGSIPDNSYDVVVAIEVIEHLLDPMSFFKDVKRILRPGGLFYYETGDIDCEEAKKKGANWSYIMPEGHTYYFSPKTLSRYFKEIGFCVKYPYWFNRSRRIANYLERSGLLNEDEIFPKETRGAVARKLLAFRDRVTCSDPFPMVTKCD